MENQHLFSLEKGRVKMGALNVYKNSYEAKLNLMVFENICLATKERGWLPLTCFCLLHLAANPLKINQTRTLSYSLFASKENQSDNLLLSKEREARFGRSLGRSSDTSVLGEGRRPPNQPPLRPPCFPEGTQRPPQTHQKSDATKCNHRFTTDRCFRTDVLSA